MTSHTPPRRTRIRALALVGGLSLGLIPLAGIAPARAIPWPDGAQIYVGYQGNPDQHLRIQRNADGMAGRRFALGSVYPGKQTTPCPAAPCIEDIDLLDSLQGGVTLQSILNEGRLGISAPKLGEFDPAAGCDTTDADPATAGGQGCDGKWGWDRAWLDVIRGAYDGWILQQREDILDETTGTGKRIVITFHPEPIREGRASLFRKAFAHVYRVFNSDGNGAWDPVGNVRWMWTFAGESSFAATNLYYYREHDSARCPDQDPGPRAWHYCADPDNGRAVREAYFPQGSRDPADPCAPRCHRVRLDYGGMDPFSHNCTAVGDQPFREVATGGYEFFASERLPFFVQETARGMDDSAAEQAAWIDTAADPDDLYSTLKDWAGRPEHLVMGFLWFDDDSSKGSCDWDLSSEAIVRFGVFARDPASFKTL